MLRAGNDITYPQISRNGFGQTAQINATAKTRQTGIPQTAVTKDTTILVLGKSNTNLFQEDPRSLKLQKVENLQQKGYSIFVLSEIAFLEKALLYLNTVIGIMKDSEK